MALKVLQKSYLNSKNVLSDGKNNNPSFGYSFFLKGVPKVPCAYCLRPTLSIPEINNFAKTLENSNGAFAMPIFQKFYGALDNSHKVIIDILKTELDERPKARVKEVIGYLANKFEGLTNQRYARAINTALYKSYIKKGTVLHQTLNTIIEESQKKLLSKPNEKSEQKVLKISVLKNGVENLIHNVKFRDDQMKLKTFLKEVNTEFRLIKMDPSTFFAKFGKDTMSSFLGSLLSPIRATADHIVTAGSHGISDRSNYILSCGKCNWDRADKSFSEFIDSKPDVLIPNIQKQFELLDHRLLTNDHDYKHLSSGQKKELAEYLSIVPDVICRESKRNIDFSLPNTANILAMLSEKK